MRGSEESTKKRNLEKKCGAAFSYSVHFDERTQMQIILIVNYKMKLLKLTYVEK